MHLKPSEFEDIDIPVADYIAPLDEKKQEKEREFFLALPGIHATGKDSFRIDKREYFGDHLRMLRREVSAITPEEFSGIDPGGHIKLYDIATLINDRCGYYICTDHTDTMDEWMRDADEEEEYCLGDVLDYHT